jgi:death-on-curing protein
MSLQSEPVFLSTDSILKIHADQIHRYGGSEGLSDPGLLESATAAPINAYHYGGDALDLYDIAGAYARSLCQNHCFVDGNKRTALAAAIYFLLLNGKMPPTLALESLYEGMIRLAEGKIDGGEFAAILRIDFPVEFEE